MTDTPPFSIREAVEKAKIVILESAARASLQAGTPLAVYRDGKIICLTGEEITAFVKEQANMTTKP